jgi:hypothetical protein
LSADDRRVDAPTRQQLVAHLVRRGIAGQVATPRHNNLRHYRRFAAGEPYFTFGLSFRRTWRFADVLAMMSKRCGVVADEQYRAGIDTIDPDRTVDALDAVSERLSRAVHRGETVMFATGHPENLAGTYRRWKDALAAAGVGVVTGGGSGARHTVDTSEGPQSHFLSWDDGIAHITDGRHPRHSHRPEGMQAVLDDLRAGAGPWPDLVIADHGFAGAAAEAGVETIGFADCNDPALFAAEAEGKVCVCVPLDDGYDTADYAPLADYVLWRCGLPGL